MDKIKSDNPDWKPETWGGPRPGSGRPPLGGDDDPTVIVTVMMPLSLKRAAMEIGGSNVSRGIRRAITILTLFHAGKPTYVNAEPWYEAVDARPRSLSQPVEE